MVKYVPTGFTGILKPIDGLEWWNKLVICCIYL